MPLSPSHTLALLRRRGACSLRRQVRWGCVGWVLLLVWLALPAPADAWRWGRWSLKLKIDMSMGYDDNVRRIALPPQPEITYAWVDIYNKKTILSPLPPVSIAGDGVHQVGTQLNLRYRGRRHVWATQYAAGFKHFWLTPDEGAFSQRGQMSYYFRAHRRIILGAHVQGADLRRWNKSREFSNVRGYFQFLWLAPHGFQVDVTGGYGLFLYRHFEEFAQLTLEGISDGERFSSHGDAYGITVRKRFNRAFRANISYQFSRQFYQIVRSHTATGACSVSERAPRDDLQHRASVALRMLYFVLLDASYQLEVNDTNSCGESYIGHRLLFRFAARPFWRLYFTAQLQLQFRTFVDGAPFNPALPTNQDDNITSFTVRISRPILPHLRINLRYSHFANLFGFGINQYARNLFTVGMTLQW